METKILNPRRIPTEGIFLHYDTNDILFALMYSLATFNPEDRQLYLSKKVFQKNKKIIYDICGITNSAMLKRHINKLIEVELVQEEKEQYTFPFNKEEKYRIIEREMLWYLASTRNKQGVRSYIILLDWFLWKQKENEYFIFTNKDILDRLGYSTNNKVASSLISNILESFLREGIIKYEKFYDTVITQDGKEIPTPKMKLTFVATQKDQLN